MTLDTPTRDALTHDAAPPLPTAPRAMTITDPRDHSAVGVVPIADAAEVTDAVARSRAAFAHWSTVAPAERGLRLRAAARLLLEHEEELAALNERETGKLLPQALGGVRAAVDTLLQYSELGPLHRGRALRGAVTAADYTVAEPRGAVAVLTPWNDPVAVAAGLIGAALVSGDTVIHKPSERCPHLGARLGEILSPAFPPDVLITLDGDGETGALLSADPGIAMIAHVGSSAAGAAIARAAAVTGAHVILENGGNDPLVVDAGVDPRWAAEQAALGAFANSGQICTSVERIYVHEALASAFVDALGEIAERMNRGAELGPMVDERMRRAVHEQVRQATDAGAAVIAGGFVPTGAGSHYPATVITGCDGSMSVMTEETFGPVAAIAVVGSFDDALEAAASGPYGLAATVLTRSQEHAQKAIARLPVGTVKVNAVFGGAPGGAAEPRGISGRGFGYGPELLDEFTTTKVVHLEWAPEPRQWAPEPRQGEPGQWEPGQ